MRLRRLSLPLLAALIASAALAASASADAVDVPIAEIGPSPTLFTPGNNVFTASGAGDGATATGAIQFTQVDNTSRSLFGDIVCLNVVGNRGIVIYENSSLQQPIGTPGGIILLEDNGPAASPSVDKQKNGRIGRPALNKYVANGCPLPSPWPATLKTLNLGNITLTDAPAAE